MTTGISVFLFPEQYIYYIVWQKSMTGSGIQKQNSLLGDADESIPIQYTFWKMEIIHIIGIVYVGQWRV